MGVHITGFYKLQKEQKIPIKMETLRVIIITAQHIFLLQGNKRLFN